MSIGPGYVCVPCGTFLRPRKNDVCVHITMVDGAPYQLWQADLWECPDCQNQVILGYGSQHWAEHYEPDFKNYLCKVDFTINGKQKALKEPHYCGVRAPASIEARDADDTGD